MGAIQKTRVLGFGGRCNGNSATHPITTHIYALLRTDGIYKSSFCQSIFALLHVRNTFGRVYKTFPTPIVEPCTRSAKCLPALRTALGLLLGHGSACYSENTSSRILVGVVTEAVLPTVFPLINMLYTAQMVYTEVDSVK